MFDKIDPLTTLAPLPLNIPYLDTLAERHGQPNDPYYRFLYHLIAALQPAVCLEIGVYFGVASAHMAAAAQEYGGQVIGLDIRYHGTPGNEIPARYPNYHYILKDSVQAVDDVKSLIDHYGPLGLVFQDSSHHFCPSWAEWRTYSRLMPPGAVWVCDDITPAFHDPNIDPPGLGMMQYFNLLPGAKRLYDGLHKGNRIGVVIL